MSNGLKLLLLATGTIITLIVVTVSINMAKKGQETGNAFNNSLTGFYEDVNTSSITMYDGVEVTGSDVINFIKKQLGNYISPSNSDIKITVVTSLSPLKSNSYTNNAYFADIQNFTNTKYIKPLNKFVGSVIYNNNNVITEVKFTVK